ncbi:uncharacterized protein PGTG_00910 [Puccinia graminis f. sp. tritici CRL 75-36-700-3]|uniref:Uncharacterized protein n=1 Tax=Puccinia graminis f. sp. tritici (strain CRL 75-36-700-3 / race SCCL) TaxID=418459 RepID=E3JU54_PUCGT|nr:uncharacterized protein PGTG_00910 [Puccinia graminis f. sp. tritici CRL 75-36-700-3]EFP75579.1 hypothetical protein PGTG_00910 [Puccinia graminis f. sp. tritici CRL 75-36-700-3]
MCPSSESVELAESNRPLRLQCLLEYLHPESLWGQSKLSEAPPLVNISVLIGLGLCVSTFAAIVRLEQGAEGAAVDGTDSASFQLSVEGGEEAQHSGGIGSLPTRINEEIDGESTAHRVNPVGSSAPRHSSNPSSSSRDRNVEHESRDQAPDPDGVIGVAQNRQEWPAWREHLEYITHAGAISLVTSHLARTWAPALMLEEEGSLSFVVTALAVGFYYWKHF